MYNRDFDHTYSINSRGISRGGIFNRTYIDSDRDSVSDSVSIPIEIMYYACIHTYARIRITIQDSPVIKEFAKIILANDFTLTLPAVREYL